MTVIYIDSVFFLNALMDYLLLLCAARLAGLPLRRGRYLLGALAGGAYAAAVFLPGLGFLAETPVKIAAGVLLGLAAYGGEEKLPRLLLLFFAVSCAMAGCVLGLGLLMGGGVPVIRGVFYTNVDARTLVIAGTAAYAVFSLVFRAAAYHGVQGALLPVRVSIAGRTAELTALWDTGSGLRAPDGRAVLVTAPGALDAALPPAAARLLRRRGLEAPEALLEPLRSAAPALRPHLAPYRAVGTAGGLLLAIRTDWTEINGIRYPGLTAALAPTALGMGYAALWGGPAGKGGRHGHDKRTAGADGRSPGLGEAGFGPPGAPPGRGGPLHRGQRHPAPAAEPGAGGGAAPRPGRGGPAGADRA